MYTDEYISRNLDLFKSAFAYFKQEEQKQKRSHLDLQIEKGL